jgi:hypothetical protein
MNSSPKYKDTFIHCFNVNDINSVIIIPEGEKGFLNFVVGAALILDNKRIEEVKAFMKNFHDSMNCNCESGECYKDATIFKIDDSKKGSFTLLKAYPISEIVAHRMSEMTSDKERKKYLSFVSLVSDEVKKANDDTFTRLMCLQFTNEVMLSAIDGLIELSNKLLKTRVDIGNFTIENIMATITSNPGVYTQVEDITSVVNPDEPEPEKDKSINIINRIDPNILN